MRVIDTISFSLTTHCNMSCPDCCAGITATKKQDRLFCDWAYLENAAKYFHGIRRINITGGEPSIHPQFESFAPKLKQLFGCEVLSIWTNGTMLTRKLDAFKFFDEIHITNYTESTYPGSPNNSKQIEIFRKMMNGLPNRIFDTSNIVHHHANKEKCKPCFRLHAETVEFVNGMIYPCSAGSGLETKTCIPLCNDWKEQIVKLIPNCCECVFGE